MAKRVKWILLCVLLLVTLPVSMYLLTRQEQLGVWTFISQGNHRIHGKILAPPSDSATAAAVYQPSEPPTGNGILVRHWTNHECSIEAHYNRDALSVSISEDDWWIQVALSGNVFGDLRFDKENNRVFYWMRGPTSQNLTGWIYDGVAGKLIETIIADSKTVKGHTLELTREGKWHYQIWENGKVVQSTVLEDLPETTRASDRYDTEITTQAHFWLNDLYSEFSQKIGAAVPKDCVSL